MKRRFRLSTGDCTFILTPLTRVCSCKGSTPADPSALPAHSFAWESFLIMAHHNFSFDFSKRRLQEESRESTIRIYVLAPPTLPCAFTKCAPFLIFLKQNWKHIFKKENKIAQPFKLNL